jgi:alpha-1,3-rhamnosyl/mannosyltransferase
MPYMTVPEHVSARARWLFRFATQLALWRASHVIAISEATRQDLHAFFRIDNDYTTSIPLAPAPQFRPIDIATVERFKLRYALEQGYVLHVGSRKTHKNVTGLIKAWALVSEPARRGRVLVLAGHWHSRSSYIEQEIASNQLGDRVRLLAGVEESELAALYSGADLFVFPSYYEGFGLPVLEAMACGCPVACSNRSSIPEVTANAALLFDPEAPSSIAAAIEEMLLDSELRRGYRRKSLRRAAEFSWTNTAIQTLSIYRRLAELYPACTPQL